jgi:hypothetical protein
LLRVSIFISGGKQNKIYSSLGKETNKRKITMHGNKLKIFSYSIYLIKYSEFGLTSRYIITVLPQKIEPERN